MLERTAPPPLASSSATIEYRPALSRSTLEARDGPWMWLRLEALRPLPLRWACRVLRFGASYWWQCRRRSRLERTELMRAFLPAGTPAASVERLAREHALNRISEVHLRYLVMRHDARDCGDLLEVEGWRHVEDALAGGRGAVLLSAHVGFYRLLRWHLRTRDVEALHLVRIGVPEAPRPTLRERAAARIRERYRLEGDRLAGGGFDAAYLKQAYEHLLRGGLVEIAGDGTAGSSRVEAPLRGRPSVFRTGGLALGQMAGAPVLPCFTAIERGPRFRLEIQRPLERDAAAARQEQIAAMARDYARRLERYLELHPTNVGMRFLVPHPSHEELRAPAGASSRGPS